MGRGAGFARRRGAWAAAAVGLLSAVSACGGEAPPSTPTATTSEPSCECPTGQVRGFAGSCVPAGVEGCANVFVDEDCVCRPTVAKCPAGTIPKLDEGCVTVGIRDCAPVFVDPDGFCSPSTAKCPPGAFASPALGCVALDACGTDRFGDVADDPVNVYVDPAAPADGTGKKDAPVSTLAAAMAAVESGGRIVLAEGTYDSPLLIQDALEIVGRCPALVTISGVHTQVSPDAVVWVQGSPDAKLRRLRIAGAGVGVLAAENATVELEDVHIHGSLEMGVFATLDSHVVIRRTLVEGTLSPPGSTFGTGILAIGAGTELRLEHSLVEGGDRQGASSARGIEIADGARGEIIASAVVGNDDIGVFANSGTIVGLRDSVVTGTRAAPDGKGGYGVGVQHAAVTIEASLIDGNRVAGVLAGGSSAVLTMRGNLVRRTVAGKLNDDPGGDGWSVGVMTGVGGTTTLDGDVLVDNALANMVATQQGETGAVTATRVLFESTVDLPDGLTVPAGVLVADDGRATLAGCALALTGDAAGVLVQGAASSLTVSTSTFFAPPEDERSRLAVLAADGARLDVAATLVESTSMAGLWFLGAHGSVAGSVVRGIRMRNMVVETDDGTERYERIGDGLIAMDGSTVDVSASAFQSCARAGVLFASSSGSLTSVTSTANQYGFASQGSPQPSYDAATCDFSGNTELPILTDGNLPVPNAPLDVPEAP